MHKSTFLYCMEGRQIDQVEPNIVPTTNRLKLWQMFASTNRAKQFGNILEGWVALWFMHAGPMVLLQCAHIPNKG